MQLEWKYLQTTKNVSIYRAYGTQYKYTLFEIEGCNIIFLADNRGLEFVHLDVFKFPDEAKAAAQAWENEHG
jgi:hypothetical protein